MIEVGREQALRHGVKNVEFRLGDMEEIPIDDAAVDLVFFSQSLHHALHPERALAEGMAHSASRRPHRHSRPVPSTASKKRANSTPTSGSASAKRSSNPCSRKPASHSVQTSVVHKEPETPQFQTLLAVAHKRA